MDKEKKLQSLDDSALDAVNGGSGLFSSDTQANDEIRLNLFGDEEKDSGVLLHKSHLDALVKLITRN